MIKEVFQNRVKETSINISQTCIESVRKKDIIKSAMRLYDNGCIGVASAIGNYDESQLEKEAKEALSMSIPYEYEVSSNKNQCVDNRKDILKEEEVISELEEVLSVLRIEHKDFIFSNKFNLVEVYNKLSNTNALNLEHRDKYISCEIILKDKNSSNLFDAFAGYSGRNYSKKELLALINKVCTAYRNKVELPKSNRLPVIFSDKDFLPFSKIITELNGLKFGSGTSILSSMLNNRKFNEGFSFYQSLNPEDTFSPFFDMEGCINEDYRYALIENGFIKSPYTDKKVSSMYKLPYTGSAFGEYDGVPKLGFNSFSAKPSNKTVKELLGGQMGIFVMIASGGDFTPDGKFATPVQLAYLFDGEKFIGKLPELQISSDVYNMFGDGYRGVSLDKITSLSNERYLVMEMNIN